MQTFKEKLLHETIEGCLRNVDLDFVRFVVKRVSPDAMLSVEYLESVAPLVKRVVADVINTMTVTGARASQTGNTMVTGSRCSADKATDTLVAAADSQDITTSDELKVLTIMKDMLSAVVTTEELVGQGTASYYTVLYQGNVNRWIIRYLGGRARPLACFPMELTKAHRTGLTKRGLELGPCGNSVVLDKPESIVHLSGVIFDVLAWCRDDGKLRRERVARSEMIEGVYGNRMVC